MLQRRYKESDSDDIREELERFMTPNKCPQCAGGRLKPEALSVTVGETKPIDTLSHAAGRRRRLLPNIQLSSREEIIAGKILKEVRDRLGFLNSVGVGYLKLDRSARDAVRWGSAAHPPGHADRIEADGGAVRPRRAFHRPSPA